MCNRRPLRLAFREGRRARAGLTPAERSEKDTPGVENRGSIVKTGRTWIDLPLGHAQASPLPEANGSPGDLLSWRMNDMRAQVGLIVVAVLVGSAGCDRLKKKEAEPAPAAAAPAQAESANTEPVQAPTAVSTPTPATTQQKVTTQTRPVPTTITTTTGTGNGLEPIGPIGANTTTAPPNTPPPPATTARPPATTTPPPSTTTKGGTATPGRGVPPPPGGRPKPGTK